MKLTVPLQKVFYMLAPFKRKMRPTKDMTEIGSKKQNGAVILRMKRLFQ